MQLLKKNPNQNKTAWKIDWYFLFVEIRVSSPKLKRERSDVTSKNVNIWSTLFTRKNIRETSLKRSQILYFELIFCAVFIKSSVLSWLGTILKTRILPVLLVLCGFSVRLKTLLFSHRHPKGEKRRSPTKGGFSHPVCVCVTYCLHRASEDYVEFAVRLEGFRQFDQSNS